MFREVQLPDDVSGRLFLHSMPGRNETYKDALSELERHQVSRILCLAPLDEVKRKSRDYAQAIQGRQLPCDFETLAIEDFGIPTDQNALNVALRVRDWLRAGDHVLIHCAGGVGRTGTMAICVLMALGVPKSTASIAVSEARSGPETTPQKHLVVRIQALLQTAGNPIP